MLAPGSYPPRLARISFRVTSGYDLSVRYAVRLGFPAICVPQLTSELVKKYTGDEHKETRARIGAEAKKIMKKHFRCEKTENFRKSVKDAIDAAFPQWVVGSFYDESASTLKV